MKLLRLGGSALAILLVLCACHTGNSAETSQSPATESSLSANAVAETGAAAAAPELSEIKQIALENHAYLFQPLDEQRVGELAARFEGAIDTLKDQETAAAITALYQSGGATQTAQVTQEQAQEDLHFLMNYLENAYSGYVFFGGAEVFGPLRDTLSTAVAELGDEVAYDDFSACLRKVLYPVLPDMHFRIDWQREREAPIPYTAPQLFHRNGDTFVELDSKDTLGGVWIDGEAHETNSLLMPWLDADGRLYYRIVVQSFVEPSVELLLNGKKQSVSVVQIDTSAPQQNGDLRYELEKVESTPVVHCYSLDPDNGDMTVLEEFAQTATTLRKEPYIIVDLRGNGGGFAPYGAQWLANLTGEEPGYFTGVGVSATAYSETVYANYPSTIMGTWYYDMYDQYKENGDFPGYSVDGDLQPRTPVKTDQTIFVLMDETTGSAAEYFANYLSMAENTVLVGSPTGGYFHFVSVVGLALPHSGISVSCGFNVYLLPDLELYDGIGFSPDLWCDSGDALDGVITLIRQLENAPE